MSPQNCNSTKFSPKYSIAAALSSGYVTAQSSSTVKGRSSAILNDYLSYRHKDLAAVFFLDIRDQENQDNQEGQEDQEGQQHHQQKLLGHQQGEEGTINRSHVLLERCVHHNGLDNQQQTDDQTWLNQGPIQAQRHRKFSGERSTTSVLNSLPLARTILHSHWHPLNGVLL
ncbi:hypothetical protein CLU79DRAFT_889426 [Phycomyces nitens]|nr:hypothetical protein CLU79DRAFT_889426 [Phycomyces nitens]